MQRIYLPDTQFSEILEITQKELYHQLTRVLRARVDQEVIFFDGITLQDHIYVMVHINKNTVSFRRKEVISKSSELYLELTLYQALPNKFEKLEYIMQKCVEVGYKKIVFFSSERSQKLIISENKKQRFQKILIEAVEQCGGNIVPEIEFESSFLWESKEFEKELCIVCHTQWQSSKHLSEILLSSIKINIFVWPEGGFSEKEIIHFQELWMQKIFLWERILRSETVGEVVGFYLGQKKES